MRIEIDGGRRSVEVQEMRIGGSTESVSTLLQKFTSIRDQESFKSALGTVSLKVSYYDAEDGGTIERWVRADEVVSAFELVREIVGRLREHRTQLHAQDAYVGGAWIYQYAGKPKKYDREVKIERIWGKR